MITFRRHVPRASTGDRRHGTPRGFAFVARRGAGLFVLASVLLLGMAVLQLAQYNFLESVSDQGLRSATGHRASVLAESAVTEAVSGLRRRLNDPGDALGTWVRGSPAAGASKTDSLALARLPQTQAIGRSPAFQDLDVGALTVTLTCDGPPKDAPTDEVSVSLHATVTVTEKEGPVVRRHAETRSIKVMRLGLPPAFDAVTVVIRRPTRLLRGRVDINGQLGALRSTEVPNLQRDLNTIVSDMRLARQQLAVTESTTVVASGVTVAELDRLLAVVTPLYAALASGPELTGATQRLTTFTPLPVDGTTTMALVSTTPVDLATVDLPTLFEARWQKLQQALQLRRASGVAVDAAIAKPSIDEAPHRAYIDATRAWALEIVATLDLVERWRAAVTLVPQGQGQFAALASAYGAVDSRQLEGGLAGFHRRSAVYVSGGLAELDRVMARVAGAGSPGHGVAVVTGATGVSRLTGARPGLWTVGLAGPVEVDGLTGGGAGSVWTVIAGAADARVDVKGSVQADLVLAGDRVSLDPGLSLQGRLLLEDVPAGPLQGRVTRPPSPVGGLWAVVSPWSRAAQRAVD